MQGWKVLQPFLKWLRSKDVQCSRLNFEIVIVIFLEVKISKSKGQLILKANCEAEDSSKKRMNEFVFTRVESQYKIFWQNLVATFCPLFIWIKGTKCVDQGLSKIFVLWFYSSMRRILVRFLEESSTRKKKRFKIIWPLASNVIWAQQAKKWLYQIFWK